jgi:hypothetical protein
MESSYKIKPQHCKIGKVIVGKRFMFQVGVYQAKTAQKASPKGIFGKIRNHQTLLVPDNHISRFSEAVDKYAYLSADLAGKFKEKPGKIKGNQFARWNTATIEPLKGFDLARLKTGKIAVKLFDIRLSPEKSHKPIML